MRQIVQKQFIRFLKENKIYHIFQYNVKYYNNKNKTIFDYINSLSDEYNLIDHAFSWKSTEQGHGFWNIIHKQWKDLMRNNKKQQFIRFLKENNIYTAFNKYFKEYSDTTLIELLEKEKCESFISSAFSWKMTEQGHDFWHSINSKWHQTFNEYKFDRFVKFLKENNAYDTFTSKIKKLKPYMEKINERYLITRTFNWRETKEGEQFWNNINIKWLKLLDNE